MRLFRTEIYFVLPETRGDAKLYITDNMTITPPHTILVTDTGNTARQSEVAHVACRLRPMTTKDVSDITDTVLQKMLISFEELGRDMAYIFIAMPMIQSSIYL